MHSKNNQNPLQDSHAVASVIEQLRAGLRPKFPKAHSCTTTLQDPAQHGTKAVQRGHLGPPIDMKSAA